MWQNTDPREVFREVFNENTQLVIADRSTGNFRVWHAALLRESNSVVQYYGYNDNVRNIHIGDPWPSNWYWITLPPQE